MGAEGAKRFIRQSLRQKDKVIYNALVHILYILFFDGLRNCAVRLFFWRFFYGIY